MILLYNAKSVLLAVNASLRWLNNVSGVYLTQLSLLPIGQQHLVGFFRYRPLLPIGWRIVQILRQRQGTNTAPTTLSAIQADSKSAFMNRSGPLCTLQISADS
jgi:hypothetical protein